jgi:hypothetical protein
MKRLILFASALFLTTFAFAQEYSKEEIPEGVLYIEQGVELSNPEDYKTVDVLVDGKVVQMITKKVQWRTPRIEFPEGYCVKRAYSMDLLSELINKVKDEFIIKEVYEDNGTYFILLFPKK